MSADPATTIPQCAGITSFTVTRRSYLVLAAAMRRKNKIVRVEFSHDCLHAFTASFRFDLFADGVCVVTEIKSEAGTNLNDLLEFFRAHFPDDILSVESHSGAFPLAQSQRVDNRHLANDEVKR